MGLEARVELLEIKHSHLDESVHSLAKVVADIKGTMLERFDQQDREMAGLKVCITALAEATHAGFKRSDEEQAKLQKHLEQHDQRFDQIDKRLEQHDQRFDQIDRRLEQHDQRFDQIEKRLEQHDKRFDQIDKRFDQIELLIRQLLPTSNN